MGSEAARNREIRLQYHPAQAKIFFDSSTRNKVIAKGRRFGLTRGFAHCVIEAMLDGVTPILWVDTININIDRYVERYFKPALRKFDRSLWDWRQQAKELKIMNSVCDFRSADRPENIEGFGYKLVILNEAGIILKDEYLWHNTIRPMMIDYGSPIMAGGTPKGKNLFYRLFNKGKGEDPDWESFHYTTYDNPYLSRKEIDSIAKDMPELVRRQEIMAEFLEDEFAVFSGIEKCIRGKMADPLKECRYVAGLDLAKHMDWTVLTIAQAETRQVVWFGRIQKHDWPYQKRWIESHVRRYNNALIAIDATSIGDVVMDDLREKGLRVEPFVFTSKDKRELIEGLILDIEQQNIHFPPIPELIEELKMFEIEITPTGNFRYNAPEGMHDDCVISLALVSWGMKRSAPVDFNPERMIVDTGHRSIGTQMDMPE